MCALQVDLSPIRSHVKTALDAIDRQAQICPAMDELYALLGQESAVQADQQAAELIDSLPGTCLLIRCRSL